MPEHYRIADVDIFGIGDNRCLIRPRAGGPPSVISEDEARLLASCGAYQPLEDHARAWAAFLERQKVQQVSQNSPRWIARLLETNAKGETAPSEKLVEQARSALEKLAAGGLLLSRSSFPREPARERPPIETLGFTTRRRVSELRRALDSYAANFHAFGRAPEVVVVVDSRDAGDETETREMLRDFQDASGLAVRFAGLAERECYIEALAWEARVAPEVVRFALLGDERCPVTTGSARNSLLLDCVGGRYILADDDGLCRMAQPPEASEGLEIVSQNDPTQFWFYPNRESLHREVALNDGQDLFGLHEALLGRSIAELDDLAPDLSGASPAWEGRLRRLGGKVRTSMAGVAGDSGVASTAYLSVEPRSRARLTRSEELYRNAVASRQMLRAPQRMTISDGFLTMAGNLGIDAAELFPPFPPVQRNSDGIMGRFLQNCFPASCRGYLNWAVLHDPVEGRSQSLDAWFEEIRSIRFADVVTIFLRDPGAEPALEDPSDSLVVLGRRLLRLGKASSEVFREELRARIMAREASRLAHVRRAGMEGVPEFYAALHVRYLTVMEDAITREELLSPRDLPDGSLALAQSIVGRLGELLVAWPRIWQAAAWMRADGRRLSRPVS